MLVIMMIALLVILMIALLVILMIMLSMIRFLVILTITLMVIMMIMVSGWFVFCSQICMKESKYTFYSKCISNSKVLLQWSRY